jgi:transcriptional regulator with XRE-family HTH domain
MTPMNTLPPETLGDRIRRLRRAKSLTPQELAKRVGCHQSTIYDLEGGGNPTLETVRAVAKALGITPSKLLSGVREDVTA